MGLLDNDEINKAMIEGLKSQLRIELKEELMKPINEALKSAEEKVDKVVNNLCERIDLMGHNYKDPFSGEYRRFRLEWIVTHNHEHLFKKETDNVI